MQNPVFPSLLCFLLVIFFAFAKSDIIAFAIVILKPTASVIFYSPYNSRSEYHSAKAEYHCEAISLAKGA